jgi:hypothetical protein
MWMKSFFNFGLQHIYLSDIRSGIYIVRVAFDNYIYSELLHFN